MFENILRHLDFLTWGEAEKIASKIHKKVMARNNLEWINSDALEKEIETEIELKPKSKEKVKRILAQKMSKSLLKKCANSLGVELQSLMCKDSNTFIIHKYMNPWVLLDEHASHIEDPIKNYSLWYTHKHRQWYESLIDVDNLIPNLVDSFEKEFVEELNKDSITRLRTEDAPIKSVLYKVNKQEP